MNDSYLEVMVKRKTNVLALIGRNTLVGLGALVFLVGFLSDIFLILAIVAGLLFLGAFLFHRQIGVEFEYLYLEKTLSIDKISNQTTRKKLAEYSMEHLELLAPVSSHRLDSYASGVKTVDYSSRQKEGNPYALIFKQGSLTTKVLIDCTEELYDQIRMTAPRKVFKD